jgi:ATP-binding cassette subfamily E protein 1|mmetsp:Transcript_77412/g.113415  ORF Transcript_77412/g.113415 Transcript_77412/m.113415 type:complete len:601 (-) Transcript_77412:525-2327(-)
MGNDKLRIAVVSFEKCKPSKCRLECKISCPVVRMGKLCISVEKNNSQAEISEKLCIGCGICVKKCPHKAIKIVNLPLTQNLKLVHQYGINSFRLFGLPIPRQGQILGLIGSNGIGKSTVLKILSGDIKPNLGNYFKHCDEKEIKNKFKGSELQMYLDKLYKKELKVLIKPQYIDTLATLFKCSMGEILEKKNQKKNLIEIEKSLELKQFREHKIIELSGGELQRLAISLILIQESDVLLIDEFTSYLDIKQKIQTAKLIKEIIVKNNKMFIITTEHDLSIADFLSDYICCMYGESGAYGIVSMPYSVREGLNIFLSGFIPIENIRFRESTIDFSSLNGDLKKNLLTQKPVFIYKTFIKYFKHFNLFVNPGQISESEVVILLGENGSGKTTFIKILAGFLKPDEGEIFKTRLPVSYKPQKISPDFDGTVKELLLKKLGNLQFDLSFKEIVLKPLKLEKLESKEIKNLSGGELQRVAICICLAKKSSLYLIDEPSAYLDSEERINVSKVLKKFTHHYKKICFIVEHDLLMGIYLGDKIIVFTGTPSVNSIANTPLSVGEGINKFLRELDITFRRDPVSLRPRINKLNSAKHKDQKKNGNFLF